MTIMRSYAIGVGVTPKQMQQAAGANNSADYSTPAGKVDVGIGFTLANRTGRQGVVGQDIAVDIYILMANGQLIYKVAGMPILAGASEEWVDGNKIALLPGDSLWVISSLPNSLDAELIFDQDVP
jgi:hypothetical protein